MGLKPSRYDTHMEVNGIEDVPVTVYYRTWPARAGKTDGKYGPKLEPDEPAGLEIDYVEWADGRTVELTTIQKRAMEEEICLWLSGYYDGPEPERHHAAY